MEQQDNIEDEEKINDLLKSNRAKAESSASIPDKDDYVVIDGKYRLVKPYHFDFICSVKKRNEGQGILDIFSQEFPSRNKEYYAQALARGSIRLENTPNVDPDTLLYAGTVMRHLVHRHEPPIPAGNIQIIGQTDDYVAINKPYGVPVHVVGQYRKNTVLGVLTAENPELGTLFPVHRLDKPVSGVLLFAKNSAAADSLRVAIADGDVEKVYIARVQGIFPSSSSSLDSSNLSHKTVAKNNDKYIKSDYIIADAAIAWDSRGNTAIAVPNQPHTDDADDVDNDLDDEIEQTRENDTLCTKKAQQITTAEQDEEEEHQKELEEENITTHTVKRPKNTKTTKNISTTTPTINKRASIDDSFVVTLADGRQLTARRSKTLFRLISVAADGKTSLVECRPLTGRTHQIRVHLSSLGYPIGNDSQYGGNRYEGPVSSRMMAEKLGIVWGTGKDDTKKGIKDISSGGGSNVVASSGTDFRNSSEYEVATHLRDPLCIHCPYYAPKDYPADLKPLWLHAQRYACSEWEFEAKVPMWAEKEWVPTMLAQ